MTRAVIDVGGGYYIDEHPHTLTLAGGEPAGLAGDSRLALRLIQAYRVVESASSGGPFIVRIAGYFYSLDDDQGREILSFQWHPQSRSPITTPHLHLGAGAHIGRPGLAGSHIPTGYVTLEQVLRLAIEELDVEPLRDDWRSVLEEGQSRAEESMR